MHVISRKVLRKFAERHPDSKTALDSWFHVMKTNHFAGFNGLRKFFPDADKVGSLIVFNIGGNKYRLIASIHFNRQKVYIRHILTHQKYNQGKWKQ